MVENVEYSGNDECIREQCDVLHATLLQVFAIGESCGHDAESFTYSITDNSNQHTLKGLLIDLSNQLRCLVDRIAPYVGYSHKAAHGPSPTALSINQFRSVYTTLELLWELKLFEGIKSVICSVEVSKRLFNNLQYPKTLLISESMMNVLYGLCCGEASGSNSANDFRSSLGTLSLNKKNFLVQMETYWCDLKLYLDTIQCHAFSSFMLQRHLKRGIVAMLGMLHMLVDKQQVLSLGDEKLVNMINDIQSNLHDIVYNNVTTVASEFRVLSLASTDSSGEAENTEANTWKWLQRAVSSMMSHLLAGKALCHGECFAVDKQCLKKCDPLKHWENLEQLLKGYLEGITDGGYSTKAQQMVAVLVTTVPKCIHSGLLGHFVPGAGNGLKKDSQKSGAGVGELQYTEQEYYDQLNPQVIELYIYAVSIGDAVLSKVCVLIIQRLAFVSLRALQRRPVPTTKISNAVPSIWIIDLIHQLVAPLMCLQSEETSASSSNRNRSSESALDSGGVLVDDKTVEMCLKILHNLVYMCPVTPYLMVSLYFSGVVKLVLTHFATAVLEHSSVCPAKPIVMEFCRICISNCCCDTRLIQLLNKHTLKHHKLDMLEECNCMFLDYILHGHSLVALPRPAVAISAARTLEIVISCNDEMKSELDMGLSSENSNAKRNLEQMAGMIQSNGQGTVEGMGAMLSAFEELSVAMDRNLNSVSLMKGIQQRALSIIELLLQTTDSPQLSGTQTTSNQSSSSITEDGEGAGSLLSMMFTACLSRYLGSNSNADVDDNAENRMECGIVLMILKERVPMNVLLCNSVQIITLIKVLMEAYVDRFMWQNRGYIDANAREHGVHTGDNNSNAANAKNCASNSATDSSLLDLEKSVTEPLEIGKHTLEYGEDDEELGESMLREVLQFLSVIVGFGNKKRSAEEESLLRECLPCLEKLAITADDAEKMIANSRTVSEADVASGIYSGEGKIPMRLSEIAIDISLAIMTRSKPAGFDMESSSENSAEDVTNVVDKFNKVLIDAATKYLISSDAGARAYGIHTVVLSMRAVMDTFPPVPIVGISPACGVEDVSTADQAVRNLLESNELKCASSGVSKRVLIEEIDSEECVGEDEDETDSSDDNEKDRSSAISHEDMQSDCLDRALDLLLTYALNDDESFVYLAVIHALWKLSELRRDLVLSKLLYYLKQPLDFEQYSSSTNNGSNSRSKHSQTKIPTISTTPVIVSMRSRILMIEVLNRIVRHAGPTIHPTVHEMVPICIDLVSSIRAEYHKMPGATSNVSTESIHNGAGTGTGVDRMVAVDIVRNMRILQPSLCMDGKGPDSASAHTTTLTQVEVDRAVEVGGLVLLRQSVISLLAVCIGVLGYGMSAHMYHLLDMVQGVLNMENVSSTNSNSGAKSNEKAQINTTTTQAAISSRRGVAFLLYHLVDTLQDRVFYLPVSKSASNYLSILYSCIKTVSTDRDSVARHHGEMCLSLFNELVKMSFIPSRSDKELLHVRTNHLENSAILKDINNSVYKNGH